MVLSLHSPQMGEQPVTMARFSGSNPDQWILQAERYFTFYRIRDDDRVSISSFYFDEDAAYWFDWMFRNHQLSSWSAFQTALLQRFRAQRQHQLDLDTNVVAMAEHPHQEFTSMISLAKENTRLLRQILDLLPLALTQNSSEATKVMKQDFVIEADHVFEEMSKLGSVETCVLAIGDNPKLIDKAIESQALDGPDLLDHMPKNVHIVTTEISQSVESESVKETTDLFTNTNQSFLFQRIWHIPWVGLATFADDVFELSSIFSGVAGQPFEANRLTASDVCVVLDLDFMSTIKEPTLVVIAFGHNTKVICIDRNKNFTLSSGAANFSVHKAHASTCMDATKLQDSHVTSKATPYVLQRIDDVPFLHTSLHTIASSRLVDFLREMTFKLSLYRFTMLAAFFRLQLQLRGRYSGLYIIMSGVAVVVYKLELPDSLQIPSMFYVSLLKSCVEHHEQQDPWRAKFMLVSMLVALLVASNCDASIIDERMSFDPGISKHMVEFIHNRTDLEKRAVHRATYLIEQWLIPWEGLPFSAATWGANKHILKTFPTFNLEDKVVLMGTVML